MLEITNKIKQIKENLDYLSSHWESIPENKAQKEAEHVMNLLNEVDWCLFDLCELSFKVKESLGK